MRDPSLEARLARIEDKLDELKSAGSSVDVDGILQGGGFTQRNGTTNSNAHTPSEVSIQGGSENRHVLDMPPLFDILPVVDSYFRHFNTALPLFNHSSFTKMLNRFYSNPAAGSKVEWAAINVVLALGYITRATAGEDIALTFDDSKIVRCIENARKQMDAILAAKDDIQGVQALVGLALLHQGSIDQETPSTWVSTALRLAHRTHLHTKASLANFSPEVAQMRTNVFWLAYFLDKVGAPLSCASPASVEMKLI